MIAKKLVKTKDNNEQNNNDENYNLGNLSGRVKWLCQFPLCVRIECVISLNKTSFCYYLKYK